MASKLSAVDPTVEKFGETSHELASRPATLSGKKLVLFWNAKPNGDVALDARNSSPSNSAMDGKGTHE